MAHNIILYVVARSICFLLFKLLFRYKIYGGKNIPAEGPYILASNHLSFLDPIAVGLTTFKNVNFIARSDLFSNKNFGFIIKRLGSIPLDRNHMDIKAIRRAMELLRQKKVLVVFPEGKRSPDGNLGKPLSGVELLARRANAAVVPVYLKGTNLALPLNARFIRLKKIRAFVGKPIMPDSFKESGTSEELITKIWGEIRNLKDKAEQWR